MAASHFSVTQVAVGVLVLGLAACDDGRPARFGLPTAPTAPPIAGAPPAPAPAPGAPPRLPPGFGPLEYTPLTVGEVVRGTVTNPPECLEERDWPCRYFQLIAPVTGDLTVEISYAAETQGFQAVDLTVQGVKGTGKVWAQSYRPGWGKVVAPVEAGNSYHITMWYAFDRLEFELRASM